MASFKGIVSVVGAFFVQLKHFLTNSNGILKDQNVMLFQLAKKKCRKMFEMILFCSDSKKKIP